MNGTPWDSLADPLMTTESILTNKGLAKLGDAIVNLCYSLAKSLVIDEPTGEKVRDRVLAHAIRATPVYSHFNRRTDVGGAADGYEAAIAYLWLTDKISIKEMVLILQENLTSEILASRKKESRIAAPAFQLLLEHVMKDLPKL